MFVQNDRVKHYVISLIRNYGLCVVQGSCSCLELRHVIKIDAVISAIQIGKLTSKTKDASTST